MKSILIKDLDCFKDPDFKFEPKFHKYTYDGFPMESVTKFIQRFHSKFDQEFWSNKKAEESGVPVDEILREWKRKNDYANEIGTQTHEWIENYFNQIWQQIPTNEDVIHRINKFNRVYSKHLYKLEPVVFELRIFSKKWKLAGTIDSLFLFRGKLYIVDWKTNGDMTHDDHHKGRYENLLNPFEDHFKNHVNEYSIQISLYAAILKEWGFDVAGGFLVHIGPGEEDATIYKCVNMVSTLEKYLDDTYVSKAD